VSTLEDDLGLTLFERSRRGVLVTPGAAPVLTETKRMLASLQAVTDAAEGATRGTTGELRLGVRSPPLGVVFRVVDELNAQVEFSLAWPREVEGALIDRFLTSMRAGASEAGVVV
jgi:DNA-binding transcriptional LysR family regulator